MTSDQFFLQTDIFLFLKFFDPALADDDPANYYMEREWRVLGKVNFSLGDVRRLVLPEAYVEQIRADFPEYAGHLLIAAED